MTLPNGLPIQYIDKLTSEYIYREIFVDKIYTSHGIVVKDGDIIFDVGGNIGLFTLFADRLAPNLRIYTFEPVAPIFEALQANISHATNHIVAVNVGLGDKTEDRTILFYPKVSGDSTIVPWELDSKTQRYVDHYDAMFGTQMPIAKIVPKRWRKGVVRFFLQKIYRGQPMSCKIRRLSDLIHEFGIERIDLMKLDAENYEWPVLQGIDEPDWPKIRQLAIEVHTHIPGGADLVERITALLQNKGFYCEMGDESLETLQGVFMLYAIRKT